MEPLPVILNYLRRIRICQRMLVISRRNSDECQALDSLGKKARARFDRLERKWLDAEDLGPYPKIPGTDPSTPQSSDAICTDALAFLEGCINGLPQQSSTKCPAD
jgi:hypothetical protein